VYARSLLSASALLIVASTANAQITSAEYAQRRDALAARATSGVILALGAPEPARDYLSFFQEPNFLYLTGFREPSAALVMVKTDGKVTSTLFVQPKDPAREVWTGNRLGVQNTMAALGLPGRPYGDLRRVLDSLLATGLPLHVIGDFGGEEATALTPDAQFVSAISKQRPSTELTDFTPEVQRLRGKKSTAELELIRQAVEITNRAHREAIQAAEPGMNEFELQGLIEYMFRRNGADRPGFATIVGSGPNSTTLHYNANDRFINSGETIVMDIGASYGGYSADVTRTIPANGTFTPEQRAIYQIVRDAQAAAEKEAKVGGTLTAMSAASDAALAAGLAKIGLIESATATYDCEGGSRCPQYRMFYMHGLGHGIGLEVHDPDQYYTGPIAVGSAFTLEPGIYVRADALDVIPATPANRVLAAKLRAAVAKYRNIGVRIEDDYIVTDKGVEWISRVPREVSEIEALMKGAYAGPPARDAATVDLYRKMK
jgi:Xaa-Pro aminopeptidase